MNIVIGTAALLPWTELEAWARTLQRHTPYTRNVLLADPAEHYRELERYGIEVIDANLLDEGRAGVCKYRWREIANFLERQSAHAYVLTTDTRDVVFQANPFAFIARDDVSVRVPGEGIKLGDEMWNWTALNVLAPKTAESLRDREVVCAGVVCGPALSMYDLATALFKYSPRGWLDQSLLNVLTYAPLTIMDWAPRVEVIPNDAGWVAQCGVALAPRLACLREKFTCDPPPVSFGRPVTPISNLRYAIVHQYDRVPELLGLRNL
jgi:hypothetical protein